METEEIKFNDQGSKWHYSKYGACIQQIKVQSPESYVVP